VAVSLLLWDQERETEILQKRLGISQPLAEVFSNDPRLKDLASWDPATEVEGLTAGEATGTDGTEVTVSLKPSEMLRPRPGPARRRRRML
jgi:hypothetical protein